MPQPRFRAAEMRPDSTRPHASYLYPYALTLRIRFKLTASPIVSSSTKTRCHRRPCQLNMVVAFAPASFTFLYRTCGAGLRRRQFFKLEHHLRLHALVWGRVSGCVFVFSLCLGENKPTVHFLSCTSRAIVSRVRAVSVTLIVERERVGPAV